MPLPPEFLADRNLGRIVVRRLNDRGWSITKISDHYGNDAQDVDDDDWLGLASRLDLATLTKDQNIVRHHWNARIPRPVFCLSNGNLAVNAMFDRFVAAQDRIWRIAADAQPGFWVIYEAGRVESRR